MTVPATGVINKHRLLATFREIVDIYSPSGKEEALAEYLCGVFEEHGLRFSRQPVDDVRYNILVWSGEGTHPRTLLLGHIDTVPAFDSEHCAFQMTEDNVCSGLGTADMKGGCAALIEAFIAAGEQRHACPATMLALVVGEEENGDGTQRLLEDYTFEQAIVAEPTDLKPCLSHYGYLEMVVSALGYRRHAAMSDHTTNAIRAMLRYLLQLEEYIEGEVPGSVLNIRDLHSSESGFAVPDRCSAGVDIHIPFDRDIERFSNELRELTSRTLENEGVSRCNIEFPTLARGYHIDTRDPVVGTLQRLYLENDLPWNPLPFKSHSDANLLTATGCKPVIIGPGLLAKAHTRDESIRFSQVLQAAHLYRDMLTAFNQ